MGTEVGPEAPKLHIAMFPWLAFGHMMPFLQLSKLIAQKGHKISFLTTPRNIDRLCANQSSYEDDHHLPASASSINFVKLPCHGHPNLPKEAEAASDVSYEEVHYLFESYDSLQDEVALFLQSSKPDWIFQDFASHRLGELAHNLGVKRAYFCIYSAFTMAFMGPPKELCGFEEYRTKPEHFTVPPNWIPFPTNMAMDLHVIVRAFDNVEPDHTGLSPYDRFRGVTLNSDLVIVRSCYEWESKWFSLLNTLYKKPVFPTGLLPANFKPEKNEERDTETWKPIKNWLDKQRQGSVMFVVLGSETKPSQSELTELALGLEISNLPFLWALKTHRGLTDKEALTLPVGFEDRVGQRGMVCTSWVPQLKILKHKSVGGLLFHGGWSTSIEAVQFGKGVVLLPFQSDQSLVARFFEENQIGYVVPRHGKDGWFAREEVAESLRLVMVDETGRVSKEKLMEMQKVFSDADWQDKYTDSMLEHLIGRQNQKSKLK